MSAASNTFLKSTAPPLVAGGGAFVNTFGAGSIGGGGGASITPDRASAASTIEFMTGMPSASSCGSASSCVTNHPRTVWPQPFFSDMVKSDDSAMHALLILVLAAKGILLEDLTWLEAEKKLTPDTVVVIPLGAAAKEHGPHLKLKNDFLIAEYLKRRVLAGSDVVIAPTLNYGFYPAFLEYPGSTSLRLETSRDTIVDICRTLARFGPKRFYILNTGISTLRALAPAAEQ